MHAVSFGVTTGIAGVAALSLVNPLTAFLGAANLLLYTSVYTPAKRVTITNTWIGAVVGAVPPVMGWTACTGFVDPGKPQLISDSCSRMIISFAGALILGGILFSWQFPHFNALSWNLRNDYSRAGYRMMCVTDPGKSIFLHVRTTNIRTIENYIVLTNVIFSDLCRKTSLRHSILLSALCALAPIAGLTTWTFALDTAPFNLYMMYLAYKFYRNADSQTSRKLFRYSLIYLPAVMILMFVSKNRNSQSSPKDIHIEEESAVASSNKTSETAVRVEK